VVRVGLARVLRDNTGLIILEVFSIGINNNRNGSLSKISLKLSWIVGRNTIDRGSLDNTFNGALAAANGTPPLVRIIGLKSDSIIHSIVESQFRDETHAKRVKEATGTFNKLLFGEFDKFTGGNLVGTLKGSRG